jgi:hypothetical protein
MPVLPKWCLFFGNVTLRARLKVELSPCLAVQYLIRSSSFKFLRICHHVFAQLYNDSQG